MPSRNLLLSLLVSNLITGALVWFYKPELKPQTTTATVEQEVRYIDRTITRNGEVIHETVKEQIDKASTVLKIEQPNYLAGVVANFHKDLKWDYSILFGKLILQNTYLVGGVTVDSTLSPQAVSIGAIMTFRNIPFIE